MSDYEIARAVGASRASVQRWRTQGAPARTPATRVFVPAGAAYAYLLGQYLGDGHITVTSPGAAVLAITLAEAYPGVTFAVASALGAVFPDANIRRTRRPNAACSVVTISSIAATAAFPQHGAGKKHERKIELVDWQRTITHGFPEDFIRGLIHSDGSRCINRFETRLPSGRVAQYEYPRYFFTNYSADIRSIFCEHCELLGVRWTQSNGRNISISHRDSVAILDGFVGPKT